MSKMFKISLPDGSVREVAKGSTPGDVAAAIGPGLAKAALAARVDGELRDLNRPFERDSSLALVTSRDEKDALELFRHDYAHVLAEAVQKRFPGTQITFGPATDDGFYYDFAPPPGRGPFTDEELPLIEEEMRRVIAAEPAGGRPVMSHLIGTGEIVHEIGGVMASLKALAGEILDAGPAVSLEDLTQMRYRIATAFEDAHDIRDVDPDCAQTIVTEALTEAVKLHFLQEGRWLPRYKVLLADLDDLDPDLGHATRSALGCPDLDERLDLATPIIQRIVDATGFFEWESVPQDLGQ